jgi:hypothetical protein
MKRNLRRDVLQERNPENGLLSKGEPKEEKRGENGLNTICSGGVFR